MLPTHLNYVRLMSCLGTNPHNSLMKLGLEGSPSGHGRRFLTWLVARKVIADCVWELSFHGFQVKPVGATNFNHRACFERQDPCRCRPGSNSSRSPYNSHR